MAIASGRIMLKVRLLEIKTEEMIQQVRWKCRIITDPVVGTPMYSLLVAVRH